MEAPVAAYKAYVGDQLALLKRQTQALRSDLVGGDAARAKLDWLSAHQTYHRIGAAYNAFGDVGETIDGLAQGLPRGTADPSFTGFHKIEQLLWSGADPRLAAGLAANLAMTVAKLQTDLPSMSIDPNVLSLRAHEILEGTARFQLTGQDDYGSGTSLATATADVEGARVSIRLLTPVLQMQSPGLAATATKQLDVAQSNIDATRITGGWLAFDRLTLIQRQRINGSVGQALETLSVVPDLLQVWETG
jgi:high-affinity iron transporter